MTEQKQAGALSRHDAAKYIGVSLRTLDYHIEREEIPKVKVGRRTLLRVVDLDNFLASKIAK